MIACPFVMCATNVELVVMQAQPGDDEGTVTMVPAHRLEPDSYFGQCPASLMYYPLDQYSTGQLVHQLTILRRMKLQREQAHRDDTSNATPPGLLAQQRAALDRAQRRPQCDPDRARQWFSSSSQPAPRRPDQKPMGTLPGTGGIVASVAEVKAALGHAAALIAESTIKAQQVHGEMLEAQQVLLWVKQTTVEDIGENEIAVAGQHLEDAVSACGEGMDKLLQYKGQL